MFQVFSLLNWNLILDDSPWQLRAVISPIVKITHDITTSYILNHWGQDKMATILQTVFSNAVSSPKMFEFFYGLIDNLPALVQTKAWQAIIYSRILAIG